MYKNNKKETKNCGVPNCKEEGIYPAPKSKENLNEYDYYCLNHISKKYG